MRRPISCPECSTEVPSDSRFCLSCGANLGSLTGGGSVPQKPASSSSSVEGRFPVGIVLGERYRILGLLGGGGMGEVYRAQDLKLEQQVALKFLSAKAASDRDLRERLRGEVRIARQISHRNVCRVYDLGEVEGASYISMEYVDGEDLGSLLRRIGRLPGDKATEFARRLCAGVAAAHERGVLHRDLKPANVMIDGRGQLLIMDFGLAAAADAVAGSDIRSGTPAYMAPEQKEGREVTVRSDIYSLGMVLAEMFTGQRPAQSGTLSVTTRDLDPAVEKVILRCLDPNPARRPASVLEVSRALPGGDPLAEALAAGETPSPEVVAASDDTGTLSTRAAMLCLLFIVVGIVATILLSSRTNPFRLTHFDDPPEILARKGRAIAERVGYVDPPADSGWGRVNRDSLLRYAQQNFQIEEANAFLTNSRTARLAFWYRQSPRELNTLAPDAVLFVDDPPDTVSGMILMALDTEGRLYFFSAVPPQQIDSAEAKPVDWQPLFEAAGLDATQWTAASPEWTPLASFDEQAAWTGSYPHIPDIPIRIEAAAWKGRPVFFQIRGPWTISTRDERAPRTAFQRLVLIFLGVATVVVLLAVSLAWLNYRRGRGDTQGALRLGVFLFGCRLINGLLIVHHIGSVAEILKLSALVATSMFEATIAAVLYLALEPFVRRRWPQTLISWTRLLNGNFKDSLVGGHILIGTALGIGYALLFAARLIAANEIRDTPWVAIRHAIAGTFGIGFEASAYALGFLFLFFLLRVIVRKEWLAAAILVLFYGLFFGSAVPSISPSPWIGAIFSVVQFATSVAVLIRFGVLPMAVAFLVSLELSVSPLTTDLSAWYASMMFTSLVIVLALTLWSFRTAVGKRQLWSGEFLER